MLATTGKNVAKSLGYSDTDYAIRNHVWNENKFEWCNINGGAGDSPAPLELLGVQPHTLFLTEPGVYQLIFKSKLPSAKSFQNWVYSEVLPSIRKTGSYTLRDPIEKIQSITLEDFSSYGESQRKENKTILKTHSNMLKNPVSKEKGRNGGLKAQENRRKMVEFKNMFLGLYESLFGTE